METCSGGVLRCTSQEEQLEHSQLAVAVSREIGDGVTILVAGYGATLPRAVRFDSTDWKLAADFVVGKSP